MKYNDAYSMLGAMINQAFADQYEKNGENPKKKRERIGSKNIVSDAVERKSHKMRKFGLQILARIL